MSKHLHEMSLKEIQSVGLEILKDVHDFCDSNKIVYSLYGGTMLGALRHRGFIPWDDDIDIAMPRPDYERFIRTYNSEKGYKLFCWEKQNSLLQFARVCEVERTYVNNEVYPWTKEKCGVWLDVFPLDGAPDDLLDVQSLLNTIKKKGRPVHLKRLSMGKVAISNKTLVDFIKTLLSVIIASFFSDKKIYKIIAEGTELCKSIEFGDSQHYCNFSYSGYGIKEYQSITDFNSMILVDFEGTSFWCIGGYDQHMSRKYGDYMTPPPVDKQVGHQLSVFYWKDI